MRKAKTDDMTDRFDIISRILSAVPPRNAWARIATKEERCEESLGGQFFREFSLERAKRNYDRRIHAILHSDRLLRRPRRAMETSRDLRPRFNEVL